MIWSGWLKRQRIARIRRDKRAQVYKVVGDIRRKQGQTRLAFESYREAVRSHGTGYVKTELSRIIFNDLYEGAKRRLLMRRQQMLLSIWICGLENMEV